MRPIALVLVVLMGCPTVAVAQESRIGTEPPPPVPPQAPPAPQQPTPQQPATPPPPASPPTYVVPPPTTPSVDATPPRRWSIPYGMAERWHRGRVLYGIGSVIGLIGTALTLSSVLIVLITGYPCDPNDPLHSINPNDTCNMNGAKFDPPRPTDPVPLLGYLGSSASAFGLIFTASGLGYQHHLLAEMNADTGRGVFAGGTTLGLMGYGAVGASYFIGSTHYLNSHDQALGILASSIVGTVLCVMGGLMYTIDASRMKRVWQRLSTF